MLTLALGYCSLIHYFVSSKVRYIHTHIYMCIYIYIYSPWGHKESDTTGRLNSNNILMCVYEYSCVHTCVGFPICTHVRIYVYMHTCTRLSAASVNSGRVIPMTQQPRSEHTAPSRFHRLHSDSKCGGFHPASSLVLRHQLGVPQFDSDTDCLVSVQTHRPRAAPPGAVPTHRMPPLHQL